MNNRSCIPTDERRPWVNRFPTSLDKRAPVKSPEHSQTLGPAPVDQRIADRAKLGSKAPGHSIHVLNPDLNPTFRITGAIYQATQID
jgi:hypothetical protein